MAALAFVQEFSDRRACQRYVHAVQVEFGVYHEHAPAQFFQGAVLQAGAHEQQLFTVLHVGRVKLVGQQVVQHLGLVPVAELRARADGAPYRCDPVVLDRPDLTDAAAEQLDVFSAGFFHSMKVRVNSRPINPLLPAGQWAPGVISGIMAGNAYSDQQ